MYLHCYDDENLKDESQVPVDEKHQPAVPSRISTVQLRTSVSEQREQQQCRRHQRHDDPKQQPKTRHVARCDFSGVVCAIPTNITIANYKKLHNNTCGGGNRNENDAWMHHKFSCNNNDSFLEYIDDTANDKIKDYLNGSYDGGSFVSYGGRSVAKTDPLALDREDDDSTGLDDSTIIERILPDNERKSRRRRRYVCVATFCAVLGIVLTGVVTAVMLTVGQDYSNNETSREINEGSNVESSHNITFSSEELPELYYILEPKVVNASALLDSTTAEGKAFFSLYQKEDLVSYSNTSGRFAEELRIIQRYALMTVYFGNAGESWRNKNGWNEEEDVCSGWHGITCENSVVTGINLRRNNLHGSISDDFCLLDFLEVIALSDNDGVELPLCTSEFPFLRELYLDGNGYRGQLPDMFYNLPALSYLDLSDNAFTGSIHELFPSSINSNGAGFARLSTLLLNKNDLSGDIPEFRFRRLRNLERLEVIGNPKLSGSLNEICKGSLMFAEADCDKVSCPCCEDGNSCPSFF